MINLKTIDNHENLLISKKEAGEIARLASHLLKKSSEEDIATITLWPESILAFAIVFSTGLQALEESGRIK